MKSSILFVSLALVALPVAAAEEHAGKPAAETKKSETQPATGAEDPGGEHPGMEHPGSEPAKAPQHPAGGATLEHPGSEHPGAAAREFSAGEIKKAMKSHIDTQQALNGGLFKFVDPDAGSKELVLKFVKIHDPVRKIEGRGYFACTDFQVVGGDKDQLFDLDFWLNPVDGKLVVTETKVHKDPILVEGKWEKKARYTFINDKPVALKSEQ